MENLKPSETLDGGSMVSKIGQAQNPFEETRETSGLSNFSENISNLVSASVVLVGKNGGNFDGCPKELEVNNVEVLNRVVDVDVDVNENKEIVVNKNVMEAGDSSKKIDVSGNISLFVEMFGPLNGIIQSNEANPRENLLGGGSSGGGGACEGNAALLSENPEAKGGNGLEGCVGNQKFKFSIGNFVWVKTKTQSWWPGLIYDPSDAPKDVAKTDRGDSHLVRYFGNGCFVWVSPSQLMPFIENFEWISRQGNSRNFIGAVEKAVDEIGRQVNMEMTCSCVTKGNWTLHDVQLDGNSGSKEGDSEREEKLGVPCGKGNSIIGFEPINFLAFLKNLSREVSMPGMLDFSVVQSNLSAFYRAIGHKQLPMHQLRGTTGAKENDGEELKAKGSFNGQIEVNLQGDPSGNSGKESDFSVVTGFQKNNKDLTRLSFEESDLGKTESEVKKGSDEAADLDVCKLASPSAEETIGLSIRRTTRKRKVVSKGNGDGGEGKSEKGNDSRERKKSKYLSPPYIYLSSQKTDDCKEVSQVGTDKTTIAGQSSGSASVVKCTVKKSQKKSKKAISGHKISFGKLKGINASSSKLLSELRFASLDCVYPKENKDFGSVKKFISGFRRWVFGYDESYDERYNKRKDGKEPDHKIEVRMEKGKGMEEGNAEDSRTKLSAGIPDVNKNADCSGSVGKDPQETIQALPNVVAKQRKRKKKEEKTVGSNANSTHVSLDMNEKITATIDSVVIDFQEMRIITPEGKPVVKKRKKKAMPTPELPPTSSGLPDLNGIGTTPSTVVDDSQVAGPIGPQEKPEPKKRKIKDGVITGRSRKKSIASLGDLNAKTTKHDSFFKNVLVVDQSSVGIPELNTGEEIKGSAPLCPNSEFADANGKNGENSSLTKDLEQKFKPEPKKRKRKEKASLDSLQTMTKFDSFFKNVQVVGGFSLDGFQEQNNTEVTASQTDLNGKNGENSSFTKDLEQKAKLEPKKRKRKENASLDDLKIPSAIPDLNGNVPEPNLLGKDLPEMNSISTEGKKPRKRRRREKPFPGVLDINVNYNKEQSNGESFGTALLLKFAPESPLPSKEALAATFSGFASLKESETLVLNDSGSAQIVFSESSDARNAFLSLQKNSPFGADLVNYRLVPLSDGSGTSQLDSNLHVPLGFKPVEGLKKTPTRPPGLKPNHQRDPEKTPSKPPGLKPNHQKDPEKTLSKPSGSKLNHQNEPPDLFKVRQNLEMMTSMLEKAGDNLSPEMREKLEREIKGLLNKVSTMVGSSSTS